MAHNANVMAIAPNQPASSTRTTSQSTQPRYKPSARSAKRNFGTTLDKVNAKLDELKQSINDLQDVSKQLSQVEADDAPKIDAPPDEPDTQAQGTSDPPQDAPQKAIDNAQDDTRNIKAVAQEDNKPADIFFGTKEPVDDDATDLPETNFATNNAAYLFNMNAETLLAAKNVDTQPQPVKVDAVQEVMPAQNLMTLMPQADNANAQSMLNMLGGRSWRQLNIQAQTQPAEVQPTVQVQTRPAEIQPTVTVQAQPADVQPTVQAQTQPAEIQPIVQAQAQPAQIQPIVQAQAQPAEIQPIVQAQMQPAEVQPIVQVQTQPAEIQPTVQAQTQPAQVQPTVQVQAQPAEIQPTVQAQTQPAQVQPIVQAQTQPVEIQPTVQAQAQPAEIQPIVQAQTQPVEIQPTVQAQAQLAEIQPTVQAQVQPAEIQPTVQAQAQPAEIQPTVQVQTQPTVQVQTQPAEIQPIVQVQTQPAEIQPTVQVQAQPSEIQPTVQVQTPPVEIQPTVQAQTQPAEIQPTVQPQTPPAEIQPTVQVQAQPAEIQPTVQVQTQPAEIQPTVQVQTQPAEIQPTVQPQAQPAEIQPIVQPQAQPAEIQPIVQAQTQPVDVQPTVQPQTQPAQIQPTVQLQTQVQPIVAQSKDLEQPAQNLSNLLGVNVQIDDAPATTPVTPPQSTPQQFEQETGRDAQNFQPQAFQPTNDTPQPLQVSTGSEVFAVPVTNDAPQSQPQPAAPTQTPDAPPPIPEDNFDVPAQIVRQARLIRTAENTQMVIKLNPEHLGELTLRISVSANGAVNASFHSDNAQVRTIIENTLVQLRQELNNAGLKVENVQVYSGLSDGGLMNGQGGQAWQQNRQQRQGNRRIDFDALERDIDNTAPVNENSSADGVDYSV